MHRSLGAEQPVSKRLAPPADVSDEKRRGQPEPRHAFDLFGVQDAAVLDAMAVILARRRFERGLIRVDRGVDRGVAVGVHPDLPAAAVTAIDGGRELFDGEVQLASRGRIQVGLALVAGAGLIRSVAPRLHAGDSEVVGAPSGHDSRTFPGVEVVGGQHSPIPNGGVLVDRGRQQVEVRRASDPDATVVQHGCPDTRRVVE